MHNGALIFFYKLLIYISTDIVAHKKIPGKIWPFLQSDVYYSVLAPQYKWHSEFRNGDFPGSQSHYSAYKHYGEHQLRSVKEAAKSIEYNWGTRLSRRRMVPAPAPPPSPFPVSKLDRPHIGRMRKRDNLLTELPNFSLQKYMLLYFFVGTLYSVVFFKLVRLWRSHRFSLYLKHYSHEEHEYYLFHFSF
jgi:hypothetical protein